jgi:protein-tyrosine phosphatase
MWDRHSHRVQPAREHAGHDQRALCSCHSAQYEHAATKHADVATGPCRFGAPAGGRVRFDLEADARYVLMRVSGLFAPPDAVEIIPGFHVGAQPSRRAAREMAAAGVSHVIDLRADTSAGRSPWPESVKVISYPLVEYAAPDLPALLGITRHVAALVESGETVYVHCREGIQRAPMVACAVLVHMGWSLADAYQLVNSRRGVTALSEAQLTVLHEMEAAPAYHPGLG